MKITVIGCGYVGLVVGSCFAEMGNIISFLDNDQEKIKKLRLGEIPIYEPGLKELIVKNKKRMKFLFDDYSGINNSDLIFICVGTPSDKNGNVDLSVLWAVCDTLKDTLTEKKIVVIKSTVPIGTSKLVYNRINNGSFVKAEIVSNPEFLKEGSAIFDCRKPNRVIIGTTDEKVKNIMQDLYEPFVRLGNPIIFMNNESAELTKYAANTLLASRIAFMNEIAMICDVAGANIDDVRKGVGSDNRIGKSFLFAGPGFGGSCFPKDVQALTRTSEKFKLKNKIISSIHVSNEQHKKYLFKKIKKFFGKKLPYKKIAIWGGAFKANTDDIREAPVLSLIQDLVFTGCAKVCIYDPQALENIKKVFGNTITYSTNIYDCCTDANAIVIMTEWKEFYTPDFVRVKKEMKQYVLFDGRNIHDPAKLKFLGFKYFGIGKQ